jgi:hypothetical protein
MNTFQLASQNHGSDPNSRTSVPDNLIYTEKPRAAAASRIRQTFLPVNGRDFSGGNQVHFSLSSGKSGSFLDPKSSYLKFKLVNTTVGADAAHDLILDGSAHSIINLLEVYYGSQQLTYTREYAALVSALMDSQASSDRILKNGDILEGVAGIRTGDTITAVNDVTTSATYCIPLVCGIIGSLAEKMLPVGALTRDNLKVSITLADHLDLLAQTNAAHVPTWKVTDLELICEYIMINDSVARAMESMNPLGIRIPFTSFSLQSNSVPIGVSSANILLSGNFKSVKTIFSTFRLDANKNASNKKYVTARVNPILGDGSWNFDIGGYKVPQQSVRGSVETYYELQKAFHNYNSVDGHGIHTKAIWDDPVTGSFLVGIDLDHFGGKSSVSESGVDISTSSCYLQTQFHEPTTAALRVDTWFHYDAVLFIAPDGSMAQTLV